MDRDCDQVSYSDSMSSLDRYWYRLLSSHCASEWNMLAVSYSWILSRLDDREDQTSYVVVYN